MSSPIEGKIVLGPNWFASVMGTGIIAVAAALLPVKFPGLFLIASVAWALSLLLLLVLLVVIPVHWIRQPQTFKAIANDPISIQFFGAPPMALMTVGSATLLVGSHYLGKEVALAIDAVLWTVGTLLGFITAVSVPYRLFTQLGVSNDAAFGGWLMPVVPPMVSAAAGALLIPFVEYGVWRESMLVVCYGLFGMSLMASLIIITMIWSRLAHFGSSGSARVPTLWIVLGPVGQSITAASGLGMVATIAIPEPFAMGFKAFALVYGIPMWGFIWLWLPIALLLTLRARKKQMRFALTWWSFTFPIGTCVTGTSQLAHNTGLPLFQWAAVVLFAFLLSAWLLVLIKTAQGSISGKLLTPPIASPSPKAIKG
ncbi:C4-dicarboxylate ABC transporter [Paucibacter sp. KCTC 42545]|nr:C4-dicarboxylate ABC transporter [Paucibacter sp. KCTC 42545]